MNEWRANFTEWRREWKREKVSFENSFSIYLWAMNKLILINWEYVRGHNWISAKKEINHWILKVRSR